MLVEERTAIRVEEITTSDALEALEPEWEQLWRSCPLATPFQSPQWLITWWRHFGGGELWTFGFRSEQRLVGLAPFYITRSPQSEARTVLLLGMGLSDYLDILAEPGFEISLVSALSSHLAENTSRWEVCDFQELRAGSLLLRMSPQKGWRDETHAQSICPVLPLIGGRNAIPKPMRDNIRYYRRRIAKNGGLEFETADASNFRQLFDMLLRLHCSCWKVRRQNDVLSDSEVQSFHREAAWKLFLARAARLHTLRIGKEVAACIYGLAAPKRAMYYLSGFDPRFAWASPGTLTIGYAIEQAAREGNSEFDFLRGTEPYKYMWGARDQSTFRRTLWSPMPQKPKPR